MLFLVMVKAGKVDPRSLFMLPRKCFFIFTSQSAASLSKYCHHVSSSCFFPSFTPPTALLSPHPSLFLLPITACLSTLWRVFSSVWLKSKTSKSPQGVPIQTRSLAAALPLLSDSLFPPLILACLLPKATSSGFILLCFNVMTSSLLLSALNPVCD